MSDPVNEQHMRAMGLDPALLGQPVPAEDKPGRCISTCAGDRCARPQGHTGDHVRGKTFWTDSMADVPSTDPTAIPIAFDPHHQRMRGTAVHGDKDFDVPFISQIEGNLYQGGCRAGLHLPYFIRHVISLYRWERYKQHDNLDSFEEVTMYDSLEGPDRDEVVRLATLVNECIKTGPTLVHCQAGLNRSGLIAGVALVLQGKTPDEAIALLRSSRSDAVLCNPVFEKWLREFVP
jgi:hypothetical protein